MRHLAVAALVFAGLAGTVCAQRDGARGGGFAGRPMGGGISMRSAPMRSAPMGSGVHSYSRPPYGGSPSTAFAANRSRGYGGAPLRRGYPGGDRFRRPYGGYGAGVPYVIPVWGGLGYSGLSGYDNGYGYSDQAIAANDSSAYAGGIPDQGPVMPAEMPPGPYLAPYQPPPARVAMQPTAPLPDADPVTLVFRDGRPSMQIHNYALTRTTLLVMDGRRREIPLDQLDLSATERVNREAGVEFKMLE